MFSVLGVVGRICNYIVCKQVPSHETLAACFTLGLLPCTRILVQELCDRGWCPFIRMYICDRFWENPYKRGKYHYSISSVLVISLIFVKIFFIMKMDVWNIVPGPGKDIRSGTHYNSRSKPNTVLKFLTSRAASIRKTGTRP